MKFKGPGEWLAQAKKAHGVVTEEPIRPAERSLTPLARLFERNRRPSPAHKDVDA